MEDQSPDTTGTGAGPGPGTSFLIVMSKQDVPRALDSTPQSPLGSTYSYCIALAAPLLLLVA